MHSPVIRLWVASFICRGSIESLTDRIINHLGTKPGSFFILLTVDFGVSSVERLKAPPTADWERQRILLNILLPEKISV